MATFLFVHTLLLSLFFSSVSSYHPPFNRLHWHKNALKEWESEYVKLPSLGSKPTNKWLRFVLDPHSTEIVVPGREYARSASCRLVSQGEAEEDNLWEDTWYFDTDVAVLRFRVDPTVQVGSIGMQGGSDLWTQFLFVEFCPALGEVYLHKNSLILDHLVCGKALDRVLWVQSRNISACVAPLFPIVAGKVADHSVSTLVGFSFMEDSLVPGPPAYYSEDLDATLRYTLYGLLRLAEGAQVTAVSEHTVVIAHGITDENNEHFASALTLGGFMVCYMYFLLHGVVRLSVSACRVIACYTIFGAVYIHHHLDVVLKTKYFLLPYDLSIATNPLLVNFLSLSLPIAATMYLVLDAHTAESARDVFRTGVRGLAVSFSTLLPSFFILLVTMDKINIILMAVVGGLANLTIIRDLVAPFTQPVVVRIHTGVWAVACVAGCIAVAWIYVAVFFPLVSEVLLFATLPMTVVPYAITAHLFSSMYLALRENVYC